MRILLSILFLTLASPSWGKNLENELRESAVAAQPVVREDAIVRLAATREQRALRRLLTELNDLRTLIEHVSKMADPDARIRFDYSALLADIDKIEAGMNSHLTISTVPRTIIEPIRGQYSR